MNTKISDYIDTLILAVFPSHANLEDATVFTIINYVSNQSTIFSGIYGAYLSFVVLFTILYFARFNRSFKKEMLMSNRLLYIMDFESLKEPERNTILKFL